MLTQGNEEDLIHYSIIEFISKRWQEFFEYLKEKRFFIGQNLVLPLLHSIYLYLYLNLNRMCMKIFMAILAVCFSCVALGNDVNGGLRKAVSSSNPEEQVLQDLLATTRNAYNSVVNKVSSVQWKNYIPRALFRTLATHVKTQKSGALAAIAALDNALATKYKEEAAFIEKALAVGNVDINKQDTMGRTLLHTAIHNNKPTDIIIPLLVAGASSSVKDNEGLSPLQLAYNQCMSDKTLDIKLVDKGKYKTTTYPVLRSCWTLAALVAYEKALSNKKFQTLYNWLIQVKGYLPSQSFVEAFADALTEI